VFPNVSAVTIPVRKLADPFQSEPGVAVNPEPEYGEFGEGFLKLCYAA